MSLRQSEIHNSAMRIACGFFVEIRVRLVVVTFESKAKTAYAGEELGYFDGIRHVSPIATVFE